MKKILRYEFDIEQGKAELKMFAGAEILEVSSPHDQPSIFVMAVETNDLVTRRFETIPVGGSVNPKGRTFIGRVTVSNRSFLVFEVN